MLRQKLKDLGLSDCVDKNKRKAMVNLVLDYYTMNTENFFDAAITFFNEFQRARPRRVPASYLCSILSLKFMLFYNL